MSLKDWIPADEEKRQFFGVDRSDCSEEWARLGQEQAAKSRRQWLALPWWKRAYLSRPHWMRLATWREAWDVLRGVHDCGDDR